MVFSESGMSGVHMLKSFGAYILYPEELFTYINMARYILKAGIGNILIKYIKTKK